MNVMRLTRKPFFDKSCTNPKEGEEDLAIIAKELFCANKQREPRRLIKILVV